MIGFIFRNYFPNF